MCKPNINLSPPLLHIFFFPRFSRYEISCTTFFSRFWFQFRCYRFRLMVIDFNFRFRLHGSRFRLRLISTSTSWFWGPRFRLRLHGSRFLLRLMVLDFDFDFDFMVVDFDFMVPEFDFGFMVLHFACIFFPWFSFLKSYAFHSSRFHICLQMLSMVLNFLNHMLLFSLIFCCGFLNIL